MKLWEGVLVLVLVLAMVGGVDAKKVCWSDGNESGVYSSYNEPLVYHSNYNTVYIKYTVCTTISGQYTFIGRRGSSLSGYSSPCNWLHMDSGLVWINPGGACVSGYRTESRGFDVYRNQGTADYAITFVVSTVPFEEFTCTGTQLCTDHVQLYVLADTGYELIGTDTDVAYSFTILNTTEYRLVFSDGAYHDFTCDGNEVFDYDACSYVYGYTCGVGDIHLYVDDGGWVLNDSVSQGMGLSDYEMVIYSGEDYKLDMYGISQLVDSYLFSCTGSHVQHSYDRCVYPPGPGPYDPVDPIIIWEGYDYNIVVFRDEHGNRVENAQVAVYDKTNSTYLQRWTPNPGGYLLLGALFNDSDHAVQVLMRTFDGVFTLETTYPANGSAIVGSEDVTQTNMTIPIHYNIRMETLDQFGTPLTDVFAGLSEYTALNPLSFWGYSMYGQQYVPVTNCSGFAMCDIYAEKGGYADYEVTALNWTSRSAMIKDYRHDVVLAKE